MTGRLDAVGRGLFDVTCSIDSLIVTAYVDGAEACRLATALVDRFVAYQCWTSP